MNSNDQFEIVIQSELILAEPTMSVMDKVMDKCGTRDIDTAYLNYLYSTEGKGITAQNYYRPRNATLAKEYAKDFPTLKLFTLTETFGDWIKVQKEDFASGGSFDQISQR